MGDLNVRIARSRNDLNQFTRSLLNDIHALEKMLELGWFNESPLHIGAEQEMCIVDKHYKPAHKALKFLEHPNTDDVTTELALFNLELNMDPIEFKEGCFSTLEQRLQKRLQAIRKIGESEKLELILTGILPTMRKFDLDKENLTPLERYHALMEAIGKMRGNVHELKITGLDELNIKHDSAMFESCNTSFQVHLQVRPDEFVRKYNIAQVLAGPVLAISVNSPLLFGKKLWSETRIALFQQTVDTRRVSEHLRDRSGRVMFGNDWVHDSMVELFKEDISRFRVMLMCDTDQDAMELIEKGKTPKLRALNIHNSTVYRWNRACYGISPNGKPHLRIENRVLPSGPTVADEVSNAAFWIGLMTGFEDYSQEVTKDFEFDHVKENFLTSARNGLGAKFTWKGGKKIGASELVSEVLLPIAREGLSKNGVLQQDIDRYMGIIEARNANQQTGAQWMLNSVTKLKKETTKEEILIAVTSSIIENQKTAKPVHEWDLACIEDITEWHPYFLLVEEFMTTDLFTVHQDDIPELVADILNWRKIKYVPVEDAQGKIKGLVNYRDLLKYFSKQSHVAPSKKVVVKDLMDPNPVTINPESTIRDALKVMKEHRTDCLPVVKNGKLVGIITEGNFINITATLLKNIDKS